MAFRRQTLEAGPGAEQNGEFALLVTHLTSEEPRQIEKRHGAKINRLAKAQSFKGVLSVAVTSRDGPDAQSPNAREGERCRRREPDAPERRAIIC